MDMTAAGLTRGLAEFAAGCAIGAIPPSARAPAIQAIADCIGAGLAGAGDAAAVRARAALEPRGGACTVWGTPLRADVRDAALANGTAAHALAIDDTNESMRGHPSAPIVPAVFALGEAIDADGQALLAAYVVGVEVAARLGRAVNDRHSELGWHTTVTLGTVGAAAAAGHLLRLDAGRMAHAIGIAAGMAGGLRGNFGTMTKALGPGLAAQHGVLAAKLAHQGFTANPDVLEAHEGFVAMFCGREHARPGRALDNIGAPFEVEQPGVVFKIYPNCSLIHTTIDMVLDGVAAREIAAEAVRAVDVEISPRLDRMRVKARPEGALQAKFSVEYAVACALLRQAVGVAEFTDGVLADQAVRGMMDKVSVHVGDGFGEDNGDLAAIRVTDRQGGTWSHTLAKPRGHRTNPLPPGALERKFVDGAAGTLGRERAVVAWRALLGLETARCREISALLALQEPAA